MLKLARCGHQGASDGIDDGELSLKGHGFTITAGARPSAHRQLPGTTLQLFGSGRAAWATGAGTGQLRSHAGTSDMPHAAPGGSGGRRSSSSGRFTGCMPAVHTPPAHSSSPWQNSPACTQDRPSSLALVQTQPLLVAPLTPPAPWSILSYAKQVQPSITQGTASSAEPLLLQAMSSTPATMRSRPPSGHSNKPLDSISNSTKPMQGSMQVPMQAMRPPSSHDAPGHGLVDQLSSSHTSSSSFRSGRSDADGAAAANMQLFSPSCTAQPAGSLSSTCTATPQPSSASCSRGSSQCSMQSDAQAAGTGVKANQCRAASGLRQPETQDQHNGAAACVETSSTELHAAVQQRVCTLHISTTTAGALESSNISKISQAEAAGTHSTAVTGTADGSHLVQLNTVSSVPTPSQSTHHHHHPHQHTESPTATLPHPPPTHQPLSPGPRGRVMAGGSSPAHAGHGHGIDSVAGRGGSGSAMNRNSRSPQRSVVVSPGRTMRRSGSTIEARGGHVVAGHGTGHAAGSPTAAAAASAAGLSPCSGRRGLSTWRSLTSPSSPSAAAVAARGLAVDLAAMAGSSSGVLTQLVVDPKMEMRRAQERLAAYRAAKVRYGFGCGIPVERDTGSFSLQDVVGCCYLTLCLTD